MPSEPPRMSEPSLGLVWGAYPGALVRPRIEAPSGLFRWRRGVERTLTSGILSLCVYPLLGCLKEAFDKPEALLAQKHTRVLSRDPKVLLCPVLMD